jgi:hypothetical protein
VLASTVDHVVELGVAVRVGTACVAGLGFDERDGVAVGRAEYLGAGVTR